MQPKGEKTRKAIRWISDMQQEYPEKSLNELVMRAISQFDLNPKESEELIHFYRSIHQK